jgi:hypothetical protein
MSSSSQLLSQETRSSIIGSQSKGKIKYLKSMYRTLILNEFSSQMTAVAQNWANTLAARNIFVHSRKRGYGENIYATTSRSVTGIDPVSSFYSEIKYFRYRAPGFSKATGHFTQVVWKSSKSIGVGVAKGRYGTTFVVVNYYPPGNYKGQFRANVPRPR